jgi:hypothetical protein
VAAEEQPRLPSNNYGQNEQRESVSRTLCVLIQSAQFLPEFSISLCPAEIQFVIICPTNRLLFFPLRKLEYVYRQMGGNENGCIIIATVVVVFS